MVGGSVVIGWLEVNSRQGFLVPNYEYTDNLTYSIRNNSLSPMIIKDEGCKYGPSHFIAKIKNSLSFEVFMEVIFHLVFSWLVTLCSNLRRCLRFRTHRGNYIILVCCCLVTRTQGKIMTSRQLTDHLKMWHSSNIWK
jgi:hypothetical protein